MTIRKRILVPNIDEPKWGTSIEITDAREPVSQITLADGAVARLKLVVLEVLLLDDPGPDGKPSYHFNTQLVANIHHPEELVE